MVSKIKKTFLFTLLKIYFHRLSHFFIQFLMYHPKRFKRGDVRKILVVRLKHLGDYLLTIPTLKSLRDQFPAAQIHMVTGVWNMPIANEFDVYIDRITYYNVTKYCRSDSQKINWHQKLAVLREVSRQQIDLTIDLDGATGFLGLYLLKKTKYLSSIESLRFLQNLRQLRVVNKINTNYDIHHQHELLNIAESLSLLKLDSRVLLTTLQSKPASVQASARFFQKHNIAIDETIIGIHPSASTEEKLWEEEKFAALADQISEKYHAKIVFFGAVEDRPRIRKIRKQMQKTSIDASELTLGQFIVAVKRCQLLICLDSLPQHVAFIQQVPCVVIYFNDNFSRWTPAHSEKLTVVYKQGVLEIEDVLKKLPIHILKKTEPVNKLFEQT